MISLRAREDKLWNVLVHPHPVQDTQSDRGLNNNMPRWKIPAKSRNENNEAMIRNHHHLKGGFAEFYGGGSTNANNISNNNSEVRSSSAAQQQQQHEGGSPDRNHPSQKLAPLHAGGDRRHFPSRRCEEKPWHPSFKKATLEIFPSRPTGKRALTPPHQYDGTEVEDIPRGKKKVEGSAGSVGSGGLSDLPLFQSSTGLRAVRDAKSGARVQDKRCEESGEEVLLRKGLRKIGFVSNSDREFAEKQLKSDSGRIQNEIEFRREYHARMSAARALGTGAAGGEASGVNREASSRAAREATLAQENLSKHRSSLRRQAADRSKAYDVEIVRNLPAFVPDNDD